MRYNDISVFWDCDYVPCVYLSEVIDTFPDLNMDKLQKMSWAIYKGDETSVVVLALEDLQGLLSKHYKL